MASGISFCNRSGGVFNAFVLPHLDYCAIIWQECSLKLKSDIERIQKYGMRLVLNKPFGTPTHVLREKIGWVSLETRRLVFRLVLVFRCLKLSSPPSLSTLFMRNSDVSKINTRGSESNIYMRFPKTEWLRRSFSYKGASDWNNLPISLKRISSYVNFKRKFKEYIFNL